MPVSPPRAFEVTVDSRHRVTLGSAATSERYRVRVQADGDIVLTPLASIPARELDLWGDPALLASVKRGLEQAAAGDVVDLGDFGEYADDGDEQGE